MAFRGASGGYYGFTAYALDESLPRAAGIYALVAPDLGPERWKVLLIGETPNFAAELTAVGSMSVREARRRGATHILLHVSPIATAKRREAGYDLWRNLRSPLVGWDNETTRRTA